MHPGCRVEATKLLLRAGKTVAVHCSVRRAYQILVRFRYAAQSIAEGFESLVDARFSVTRRFSADFAQFHP
jgi:hypothetical protein